jgi:hypothetical protein
MIWFVLGGLAALAGVAAYLDQQAGNERSRWKAEYRSVEDDVSAHQARIEAHLYAAQTSRDFHLLTELHWASHRVGDQAHSLLRDARTVENALIEGLRRLATERRRAIRERNACYEQALREEQTRAIDEIVAAEADLRTQVEQQRAEREEMLVRVRSLNARTGELRDAIRDRCGQRGVDWYERLEDRKRSRRVG